MKQLRTVEQLRQFRQSVPGAVGFVPTMGALHEGHLSLVSESTSSCDCTVVSIYVNPAQFNNPQDLETYPDTLQSDLEKLLTLDVDAVFLPQYADLYPDDFAYELDEKVFSHELCGADRPGHFKGVLTVVMKLLNLVKPDKAFFGEKDFQQLTLVRGMAEAFFLDTKIVGCPTVREADGLAMSSRNLNLSARDREKAAEFNAILKSEGVDQEIGRKLCDAGFQVDYVKTIKQRRFGAVVMDPTGKPVRLIDNVTME